MKDARHLDVLQGDGLPAMLRAYGTTDELVATKYPDLADRRLEGHIGW